MVGAVYGCVRRTVAQLELELEQHQYVRSRSIWHCMPYLDLVVLGIHGGSDICLYISCDISWLFHRCVRVAGLENYFVQ
jgi:hypothetical protein